MNKPDEDQQSENNNDTGGGSENKSGSSASKEKGNKLDPVMDSTYLDICLLPLIVSFFSPANSV